MYEIDDKDLQNAVGGRGNKKLIESPYEYKCSSWVKAHNLKDRGIDDNTACPKVCLTCANYVLGYCFFES